MDELEEFWVHEIQVQTYAGSGPFGDEYAAPVGVPCFIDHKRQLVRDPDGREVTSEATITGPVGEGERFAPQSLVELGGRERAVISVAIRSSGPLELPDHFEAVTT
ncbi:MAG: hypothetical protein L0J31_09640 [Corynebacterium sp.]|nr:hypothetical protein [Corynebacterium sp.]